MFFESLFDFFLRLDGPVFAWVETIRNGFWDGFFPLITRLGDDGIFWIVLALALLIPRRTRKAGAVMVIALALDVIITNGILKNIFERPRPYDFFWEGTGYDYAFPHLVEKEPASSFSFPSGHTGISFAGALGLVFGARKDWSEKWLRIFAWCLVPLAAVIGFSRIYIGVHYATDVIGGVLVGLICGALALLVFRLAEPLYEKVNRKVEAFGERLRAKRKKG